MKRCPACGTTYPDDSLRFCLADGSLLERTDEEPTVFVSPHEPLRVPIGAAAAPAGSNKDRIAGSSRTGFKIIAAIILLSFLALLAVGIAGALFYYNSDRQASNVAVTTPSRTPTATPETTPDPDKQRLQDDLPICSDYLRNRRSLRPVPLHFRQAAMKNGVLR